MILTGPEICRQVAMNRIIIDPFDPSRVGANSYDLTLGNKLKVYHPSIDGEVRLDAKKVNKTNDIEISEEHGIVLYPNTLYLAKTVEFTETPYHVPRLDGRSSLGRLGLTIHITAAYGDVGFRGNWTCELTVVHKLRVYPGMRFCQISYHEISGEIKPYQGKYQGERDIIPSRCYEDPEMAAKK